MKSFAQRQRANGNRNKLPSVSECNTCVLTAGEDVTSPPILHIGERNIAPRSRIKEQLKGQLAVQGSLAFESPGHYVCLL